MYTLWYDGNPAILPDINLNTGDADRNRENVALFKNYETVDDLLKNKLKNVEFKKELDKLNWEVEKIPKDIFERYQMKLTMGRNIKSYTTPEDKQIFWNNLKYDIDTNFESTRHFVKSIKYPCTLSLIRPDKPTGGNKKSKRRNNKKRHNKTVRRRRLQVKK